MIFLKNNLIELYSSLQRGFQVILYLIAKRIMITFKQIYKR